MPTTTRAPMNDVELTNRLAQAILGWKPTRDRFMKPGGEWRSRSHFQPLVRIADAFRLLVATDNFSLTGVGDNFVAEVQIGARRAKASGSSSARTLTMAVSHALGITGLSSEK